MRNQLIVGMLSMGLAGWATAAEETQQNMPKDGVACFITTESITGKEVWDFHGNMIGSIESVLVKPSGGKSLLVVDADKWLEGDQKVAIPLERFYVKRKDGEPDELIYTLDTSKEELMDAPSYEDVTDPDAYNETHVRSVYDYWKVKLGNAADATEGRVSDAAHATGRAINRAAEATERAVKDAADAIEDSVSSDEDPE